MVKGRFDRGSYSSLNVHSFFKQLLSFVHFRSVLIDAIALSHAVHLT